MLTYYLQLYKNKTFSYLNSLLRIHLILIFLATFPTLSLLYLIFRPRSVSALLLIAPDSRVISGSGLEQVLVE